MRVGEATAGRPEKEGRANQPTAVAINQLIESPTHTPTHTHTQLGSAVAGEGVDRPDVPTPAAFPETLALDYTSAALAK